MDSSHDLSSYPLLTQNHLRDLCKLKTKRGRVQAGRLIIEGTRLVAEAILSGQTVAMLLVCSDDQGQRSLDQLIDKIGSDQSFETHRVRPPHFARLTDTVHAGGVVAIIKWTPRTFDPAAVELKNAKRLLIIDRVSDPGNLGALIRTAAGLGVDGIFIHPDAVELTNPKVVRATAGALFRLPIYVRVAPRDLVEFCSAGGFEILIADAHQGCDRHSGAGIDRWALVIGGETRALDPVWADAPAEHIFLSLEHGVESLNAAIAGAIFLDRLCRGGR
jgi:TrmH family RNA methyltransferase